jgi:hypothetical protein
MLATRPRNGPDNVQTLTCHSPDPRTPASATPDITRIPPCNLALGSVSKLIAAHVIDNPAKRVDGPKTTNKPNPRMNIMKAKGSVKTPLDKDR